MRHLSALFFLLVLLFGVASSVAYVPRSNFTEQAYAKALPLATFSRNLWGRLEYAMFGEGRRGVVVGQNGWLYTAEEFECPRNWQQNLARNLTIISDVRQRLLERKVPLRILIVPAKSRVYPALPLPSCRQGLYDVGLIASDSGVHLLGLMQAQRGEAFLHTDTHWSPLGAALAAGGLATEVPPLKTTAYDLQPGPAQQIEGDLLRYLPGVFWPSETVPGSIITGGNTDLLDPELPPVVLVGTSYSADSRWGFENALRYALQADVQNMADAGAGPFKSMQRFFASERWTATLPQLVIWEIPERYLVLPP